MSPDLNPIENEWAELKRRTTWIWESGEILYGGIMSDLVRFSKLIRHYRRRLSAVIGKRRLQKNGCQ